jgi:hypothetical protein
MKHLIRAMVWRLISVPFQRAVNWTSEDAKALDHFFKSHCGLKLLELLRQYVSSRTFNAVYRESVSANAEARGSQDCLAVLHRLRSFPPEESAEYADEDVEPLPSQKPSFDGRRFVYSGGNTAIGK